MTSRQEVIRSSFMAVCGKDETGILVRNYEVFRSLEPWVKAMEKHGPDPGDPEYRACIERLVSQFREWHAQRRQKP